MSEMYKPLVEEWSFDYKIYSDFKISIAISVKGPFKIVSE